MKCSICDTENPADATSCRQCGFSLGQPAWLDSPTVEIPELVVDTEWLDIPETAPTVTPSMPAWLTDDAPTTGVEPITVESITVEPAEVEPVAVEIEAAKMPPAYVPPPTPPTQDDRLARTHIARGFEAIRKNLYDQAKWEFEQARDLADDPEITEMAQEQLGELANTRMEAAQGRERARLRQAQPRPAPRPAPAE